MFRLEFYRTKGTPPRHKWRLFAQNGENVANSGQGKGYVREIDCRRMGWRLFSALLSQGDAARLRRSIADLGRARRATVRGAALLGDLSAPALRRGKR